MCLGMSCVRCNSKQSRVRISVKEYGDTLQCGNYLNDNANYRGKFLVVKLTTQYTIKVSSVMKPQEVLCSTTKKKKKIIAVNMLFDDHQLALVLISLRE